MDVNFFQKLLISCNKVLLGFRSFHPYTAHSKPVIISVEIGLHF